MAGLKYKVISSYRQYKKYCGIRDQLTSAKNAGKTKDEIALLSALIDKHDREHIFTEMNPVKLLLFLMEEKGVKQAYLSKKLKIGPGIISDIIYYRRGFSKGVIRKLADFFKVSQEAFNRPYKLKVMKPKPKKKKDKEHKRKRA
jgi:HTH-type transcriptional regulator/antitoxin HigA